MDFKVDAFLPEDYVPDSRTRMEIYKRIADLSTVEERSDIIDELIDRFGEPPAAVQGLIDVVLLRNLAANVGIYEVRQTADTILLYQRTLDLAVGSKLSAALPGRVMINAGPKPYLAVKIPSGLTSLDTLREALQAIGKETES